MKLALLLALPLLAACAASAPASPARAEADASAEALLAADRAFALDTQARRLEGWLAAFDSNGAQFDEPSGLVAGLAAIRANMAGFFADWRNELSWAPDEARVSEGGRLGSTTGRYRYLRRQADGSIEVEVVGRYFDVWRRQPNGTWKLLFDAGDPDATR